MKQSSSKNSAVILLTILVAVLLFAVYYYVVAPKKDEVDSLKTSVSSLQDEVSSIESQIAQIQEEKSKTKSNVYTLRQKVPENRDLDELLLNIEEIEYVTGSRVNSINFNNYDQSVSESNINPANDPNAQQQQETTTDTNNTDSNATNNDGTANTDGNSENTEGNNENGENAQNGEGNQTPADPVSTIADLVLNPSLKLLTFSIEVETPNHAKLREFIGEIENLERVMHVDTIQYDAPGEDKIFDEDASDNLTATIQVTTFFYTGS